MCGRYSLSHSHQEIIDRFKVELEMMEFSPRYNVAPSQKVPIITDELLDDGRYARKMEAVQWGLIPSWAKEIRPMINARAETVIDKPTFRAAFKRRRFLIPADGFYEWMGEKKKRLPVRIHIKGNGLFAFAGLYEDKHIPEGVLRTCTIITTAANDTVSGVHDRMPVILHPSDETFWLRAGEDEKEKLAKLLQPYPDDETEFYRVSTIVNSARKDVPECIQPEEVVEQVKLEI